MEHGVVDDFFSGCHLDEEATKQAGQPDEVNDEHDFAKYVHSQTLATQPGGTRRGSPITTSAPNSITAQPQQGWASIRKRQDWPEPAQRMSLPR